ncbi:hypothetical protein DPMN_042960 [Dreissena polymorpha]|uniref:Uncharacterized protein n=1 Tax=Dreissena polymorpha TaxID=45954 RepID=A0A9D4D025_DREPO|nr:hypothetical protein DPMN_042960 [Dreissena polymorpha]
MTFCLSLFVTLAVFMSIVNGSLPESSDEVSKFGVYICLQLIGCGLSTIATILSLKCFQESDHTPVRSCVRLFVMAMCVRKRYQIHVHHYRADNEVKANQNGGEIITAAVDTIDDCGKSDKCMSDGMEWNDTSFTSGYLENGFLCVGPILFHSFNSLARSSIKRSVRRLGFIKLD